MGDHETIEDLKEQLASQARLFEERLSAIEERRENTGGLQPTPTGSRPSLSGVDISGGSSLSIGPKETSSIKSAVPKFTGSGVEYRLWKRRFEGYAVTSGCMQAFTTVTDMMVGDPSVTSRFLLHQGLTEISVKRSRLAWTCITESFTDRELLSMVFDTNSSSVAWCMLDDWFLLKPLAKKSKWRGQTIWSWRTRKNR